MPRLNENAVLARLAEACKKCGGQAAFARENGISKKWVNNVLRGHVKISPGIALKIGVRRVIEWELDDAW